MSLQKNIYLAYFLSFFNRSWFWLGIWVFYYLQFTSYAGIGFLSDLISARTTGLVLWLLLLMLLGGQYVRGRVNGENYK